MVGRQIIMLIKSHSGKDKTRLRSKVIGLSGAVSGAAVCTPVLYNDCHDTVQSAQYQSRILDK